MLLFTVVFSDISLLWPVVIIFIFTIFILLTNISPMFTGHEITDHGIVLRNGILFSGSFGFDQIISVQRSQPAWRFGRIVLSSGTTGLVSIKLRTRIRFSSILFRNSDEIIIDLVRPDEFVRMANQKLSQVGFPPVEPDGPGTELGYQA
jgi:hypothetical protein